mmetsp:Transcript_46710/g.116390  ORF Transcript_46710/g.116390 Transcript_46710/m.116390 type:complete len:322 (+) Transcript_46710:2533-3498(+)
MDGIDEDTDKQHTDWLVQSISLTSAPYLTTAMSAVGAKMHAHRHAHAHAQHCPPIRADRWHQPITHTLLHPLCGDAVSGGCLSRCHAKGQFAAAGPEGILLLVEQPIAPTLDAPHQQVGVSLPPAAHQMHFHLHLSHRRPPAPSQSLELATLDVHLEQLYRPLLVAECPDNGWQSDELRRRGGEGEVWVVGWGGEGEVAEAISVEMDTCRGKGGGRDKGVERVYLAPRGSVQDGTLKGPVVVAPERVHEAPLPLICQSRRLTHPFASIHLIEEIAAKPPLVAAVDGRLVVSLPEVVELRGPLRARVVDPIVEPGGGVVALE